MDIPEEPQALVVGQEFSDGKGGWLRITTAEGEVELVSGVRGPRSITVEGVITSKSYYKPKGTNTK